jgi:hypothetical protein
MKPVLAIIAAVLAIAGNIPYLYDMVKGRVRPHPYSWLIWSIVSGTVLVGQITKGAGWGIIPFSASEMFTFIIFIFSLRYGFKKIPKRDTYFLVAAPLGLIPWIITHDPTWSVVIMVTIDVIAFIPTIKKAKLAPQSETPTLYTTNVLRHILTLFTLSSYNIATTFHSIMMIITNTTMLGVLWGGKKK